MVAKSTGFSLDPLRAKQLGFLAVGLSGSRAYQSLQRQFASTCDWDFVSVVEMKSDIIRLVHHKKDELRELVGIVQLEDFPWGLLEDPNNSNEDWEVIRFSGWAHDGSKRSLKIWSEEHIRDIAPQDSPCRFGVLSAKTIRYMRTKHPRDGNRLSVYQPLRLAENLSVLIDLDFVAGDEDPTALTPGVTSDLFLSSCTLFERSEGAAQSVKWALMRKWRALAEAPDMESLIPGFIGHAAFNTETLNRLRNELTKGPSAVPVGGTVSSSSSSAGSQSESPSSGSSITSESQNDDVNDYGVVSFLPIEEKQISKFLQYESSVSAAPHPRVHQKGEFEFRPISEKYYPSSFTSNSQGSFGEIRVVSAESKCGWSEWKPVFVKSGPHANDELVAFPTVQDHFPPSSLQQLAAVDQDAQMLFYGLFDGKTLGQIRLEYYLQSRSFLSEKGFRSAVGWFVDLELRRAERVLDTYARSIDFNPDPTSCPEQRIHRFYHSRLQSDARFLEVYSERCLDVLGVPSPKQEFTTSDFLNTPLTINGVSYPPLRHHFDRATHLLDPNRQGGLSDLPIAFGFGDGHGGNLMVAEDSKGSKATAMYIDYEVSGFHSPFLDNAKSIYNDAFFHALYADLLSDDTTRSSFNNAGATVSWNMRAHALDINYKLRADTLAKSVAAVKFQYVLLPIFDLVNGHDTAKANLSLDVLSSALFTCALLTRNFQQRPDVFFLNLAIGVRLATELSEVLSETFGWDGLPVVGGISTQDNQLQLLSATEEPQYVAPEWAEGLDMQFLSFLFSSNLQPDDVILKRADDTYKLQHRFSRTALESEGAIIQRISKARRDGMAVSPHTCIRESIFAEPRIDHHFAYNDIMTELEEDKSRLLVDGGCCMGTDIRKLVLDGYPPENILGLDLENRYFDVGRTLYNEDLSTTKLRFHKADLVDPKFPSKFPELKDRFYFVHSANVIHLFGFGEQEIFFRNLVHLVKPAGTIWGRQVGLNEDDEERYKQPEGKGARFTISDFREMALQAGNWREQDVRYEARLVKYDDIRVKRKDKAWVLQWLLKVPVDKWKGIRDAEGSARVVEEEA
ncbi:hypothetical protein N7465_004206 [Penicillium sp. CMV-2018d]|nr:hypothetical protein N7465_004206 [Penicillium sp. CMV-2018d]